jgi:ribosomal protein L11 methyltransferase
MALAEIRIEFAPAAAADVADALLEAGETAWSLWEDAVGGRAWLIGLFPRRDEARAAWRRLRPSLPAAPRGRAVFRRLGDRVWKESFRRHFKAWRFGRLHWVPAWERGRFRPPAGAAVLWLDPGMAFGTGNHESTRLCVERLAALAPVPRVIDAGCGSGILALSAAVLGCGRIAGFDCDPEAVRVSRENAARNRLARRTSFRVADLRGGLAGRKAELVLANIQADVLCRHRRELAASVAPGGSLVLSGILAAEAAQVRSAFAAAARGWPADTRVLGTWCDLRLVRPRSRR